MAQINLRGTRNASLFSAMEGILALAAVVETVLCAGLALIVSRVGSGSATVGFFFAINKVVLGPFALLSIFGGGMATAIFQQLAAMLVYGLFFLLIIGGVSWLERQ